MEKAAAPAGKSMSPARLFRETMVCLRLQFVAVVGLLAWLGAAADGYCAPTKAKQRGEPSTRWGTLTGKFVFVGDAPTMNRIDVPRNTEGRGEQPVVETEHFLAASDGALTNVVVFAVADVDDAQRAISPIHPNYESQRKSDVVVLATGLRFEPHVQVGWNARPFVYKGDDSATPYNIQALPHRNRTFGETIPAGRVRTVHYEKAEPIPFPVMCSINPWMKAWVLVRPDPYAAVSNKKGQFTIANLPRGEHPFRMWHESLGYLDVVSIRGAKLNGGRGLYTLNIQSGQNDLGIIEISATDYRKRLEKLK